MALDRRVAGDVPLVPRAAIAGLRSSTEAPPDFAKTRLRRGGYVRLWQRCRLGSITYAAGIDRRIVHSTSVRRAARNATDRHISRSCRTCAARKSPVPPVPLAQMRRQEGLRLSTMQWRVLVLC